MRRLRWSRSARARGHAERRRRCRLSLNGQVVEATPAGFGPTTEAVAAARTVATQAALVDPPPADSPLRNADEIRGQFGVVERGSVSFAEKARRWQAAGAAAVLVLNVAEADYVPLGMVGDPGFGIAVPVEGASSARCTQKTHTIGDTL